MAEFPSRSSERSSDSRPRERDSRNGKGPDKRRRFQVRKKVCRFCVDKTPFIDYKDVKTLRFFLTERGKILPRRISGNCARHQREVTVAVQRCRNIALVPFSGEK
ncbi:MAG TPA: 30S ribosomal protein S18 [Nitrospirota bacterium]|jgi:small subunit ribosomal protein S18|nr:30S ribosomal protein S18 [Nitrospirota bacterium]